MNIPYIHIHTLSTTVMKRGEKKTNKNKMQKKIPLFLQHCAGIPGAVNWPTEGRQKEDKKTIEIFK